jgi:hypothetical protein
MIDAMMLSLRVNLVSFRFHPNRRRGGIGRRAGSKSEAMLGNDAVVAVSLPNGNKPHPAHSTALESPLIAGR